MRRRSCARWESKLQPVFAAQAEAEEKVRAFERVRAGNIRTVYHPNDVRPNIVTAEFIDDASSFRDTIQIQRFGSSGWFLMIGHSTDPGPAFDWDLVIGEARKVLHGGMSELADQTSRGHLRERSKQ